MVKRIKKFFRENQQIAIIKADKGNQTIVLNKSDYEKSMNVLLNDEEIYMKSKQSTTSGIE